MCDVHTHHEKTVCFVFYRWLIFKSEYAKKRHITSKKRLLESPVKMPLTNITNFGVEKHHFKTVLPCAPGVLCPLRICALQSVTEATGQEWFYYSLAQNIESY